MPQAWIATYHADVIKDLEHLGKSDVDRVMKIIDSLIVADPMDAGLALEPALTGCRLVKVDDFHVLYQLDVNRFQLFVLAVRKESGVSDQGEQKAKTHQKVGY